MKRVLLLVLSLILILQSGFVGIVFANTDEISLIAEESVVSSNPIPESIKILCIGNSFSQDSTEWLYSVLADLGVKEIILGNLYIGGCSINKHYNNAVNNIAGYIYHENTGEGWSKKENFAIDDVVKSEKWD